MKRGFWIVGAFVALVLSGCVSMDLDKSLADPNTAPAEQAILADEWSHTGLGVKLVSIDGELNETKSVIHIIQPGTHELRLSYYWKYPDMVISNSSPITATVNLEPGHYYNLIGGDSRGMFRKYMNPMTLYMGIIDFTNPDIPIPVWAITPDVVDIVASDFKRYEEMKKMVDEAIAKDK